VSHDIGSDTIVAISTARGRGALAVVRMSGPATSTIAARVLDRWPLDERRATLTAVVDATGSTVERGIATFFRAPHSFTGEDTLEVSTHGGTAVPLAVLRTLLTAGAREALPGEFTRRAVLAGKLDLLQAEAIGDLIDARTDAMRRVAIRQVDGALSRRFHELREGILNVEALIAYDIDFPEEDDGPLESGRIVNGLESLRSSIELLLRTAPAAAIARDGAIVVLGGPPNAGKSSLFNALLGEARAIVTDFPGTTRDAIEELLEHQGWPLRLVDTAGLRSVDDPVERLGVELSGRYIAGADLVLACDDDVGRLPALVDELRRLTGAPVIPVLTKCDAIDRASQNLPAGTVATSALRGVGLGTLLDRAVGELEAQHGMGTLDAPLLTRERHATALRRAREEIDAFEEAWRERQVPMVVAAVHLHAAVEALQEITGGIDIEDVLGRLFSTFCVGK
jgi:tRNA modification GTPase